MVDVANNLETMGPEQYVLAFVFIGSYAFALGEFVGARGRCVAIAAALLAAIGFSVLSDPWEEGVILVAFALVGMGLFAGAAWALWAAAMWRDRSGPSFP
jgi:drug/metabolite transporter (DMT)-like permease